MAVRFRPFTGTSRGFPSADDVGGGRQESDVTELDRTGDPDSAGRHAAPGGDGAEGHTQVISRRGRRALSRAAGKLLATLFRVDLTGARLGGEPGPRRWLDTRGH